MRKGWREKHKEKKILEAKMKKKMEVERRKMKAGENSH